MKAPITLAIDLLVSEHVAPLLKRNGFRKRGQRFARAVNECVQAVEIDRWKYNEGDRGKFAITVGVFYPAVWQMVQKARPGWKTDPFDQDFPPIQNCLIDDSVLPPGDQYAGTNLWEVDAAQPIQPVADAVQQALHEVALPWLHDKAVIDATLGQLTEQSSKGVWLSSVYLLCAAAHSRQPTVAASALSAILAAKPSRFFPDSERQAFKAIAAGLAAASSHDAA